MRNYSALVAANSDVNTFKQGNLDMIAISSKYQSAFLISLFLLTSIYFSDLLTIENIKSNKLLIQNFIENNYILSTFLFFLACVVFVNSPMPLAAFIKFLGGYFFGFYIGVFFNILATIIACLVGF